MRIRRYYGYDCESVMGFNNGEYIDDPEGIEVKDYNEADDKIHEALAERWDLNKFEEVDFQHDDNSIQLTTGYFDRDGNELSYKEYMDIDDPNCTETSYRYVYVSYEIVEE